MLRRVFSRTALAFTLLLTGVAGTLGLTASPAAAAGTDCAFTTGVNFNNYIDRTSDNFTGVTNSTHVVLNANTDNSACPAPYSGHNSTCITVRLVVYYRPGVGVLNTYGAWVRSCWTPQQLASGWGGWLHAGDEVYLQARAEQDGGHYPSGTLYY